MDAAHPGNSRLYYDRVPFGINYGCAQDSRGFATREPLRAVRDTPYFFYCPPPFFTAFYCSFLLFTIIQSDMHRIHAGVPRARPYTAAGYAQNSQLVARRE